MTPETGSLGPDVTAAVREISAKAPLTRGKRQRVWPRANKKARSGTPEATPLDLKEPY
jgi:hypothetical protein